MGTARVPDIATSEEISKKINVLTVADVLFHGYIVSWILILLHSVHLYVYRIPVCFMLCNWLTNVRGVSAMISHLW